MSIPEAINCGRRCSAALDAGTTLTLTATARDGWALKRWRYGCKEQAAVCTLEMNSNRRAKAVFVKA